MTKKDFTKIAEMLKVVNTGYDEKGLTKSQKWVFNSIVYKLNNIFMDDNPNFNSKKFEDAIYD